MTGVMASTRCVSERDGRATSEVGPCALESEPSLDPAGSQNAPATERFKERKAAGGEQRQAEPGGDLESKDRARQQRDSARSAEPPAALVDVGGEEWLHDCGMGLGFPDLVKGVGKVVRISRRITAENRAKLRAMEPCLDKAPTAPVFATTNSQKFMPPV